MVFGREGDEEYALAVGEVVADEGPVRLPPDLGGDAPAAQQHADVRARHAVRWGLVVLNSSQGLVEPLCDGPEPPQRPVRPAHDPGRDGFPVRTGDTEAVGHPAPERVQQDPLVVERHGGEGFPHPVYVQLALARAGDQGLRDRIVEPAQAAPCHEPLLAPGIELPDQAREDVLRKLEEAVRARPLYAHFGRGGHEDGLDVGDLLEVVRERQKVQRVDNGGRAFRLRAERRYHSLIREQDLGEVDVRCRQGLDDRQKLDEVTVEYDGCKPVL